MTEAQKTLLMFKGIVANAPEDDRRRIETAAAALRELVQAHGDHGLIALGLVTAEAQAAD